MKKVFLMELLRLQRFSAAYIIQYIWQKIN